MRRTAYVLSASVLVGCALAGVASPHDRPGRSGRADANRTPAPTVLASAAGGRGESQEPWLRATIGEEERAVLLRHREELAALGAPGKKKRLPPGLAKKVARGEALPPGWQKKVARGEVLESDLYALSSRVPRSIVEELPRQPTGTVLVVLQGKIVRLVQATREILDVFDLP